MKYPWPSVSEKGKMSARCDYKAEATAFNERIKNRSKAGFVPDIRRAVKCEYFYKSFWRDPYFIDLYLGEIVRNFLRMLSENGRKNLRILDVGCGAGYISLELARAGHRVTGIDISDGCIKLAKETLRTNPFKKDFGSLEYMVMPFWNTTGTYDAILFSGVLHHLDDPEKAIKKALSMLVPGGLILCHEPCHEMWRKEDASQVALIRGLLSLAGFWYEDKTGEGLCVKKDAIGRYIDEIYDEYINERDKDETAQSPNDNAASGVKILGQLRRNLKEIEYKPSFSFIYRLLGGLRGPAKKIEKIADFLTSYDKYCVNKGFLKPNYFYFVGRKKRA